MVDLYHCIAMILNDHKLLDLEDVGFQMYSALKLQKECLASQLDSLSRVSSRSNLSSSKSIYSRQTVAKCKDPNTLKFIDYILDLSAKVTHKIPMESQKLTFSYRNWEKVKSPYHKSSGRLILSPTNEDHLDCTMIALRKNIAAFKDILDKILLGSLSGQGYQFGRPELRKVTSDINFRRVGMDIC